MRYFLLPIFFLLLFGRQASAQVYHPDFDCRRMDRNVPGQVLVCTDSDSARSSLILDQAYYALRHQSPAYLLPQLKAELLADLKPLYLCFPPIAPVEGGDSAHCYRQKVERIAAEFRSRLTPRAYQEASRPIDDHIALQHRLATLGYLRQNHLEGVYGDTTRRAILRWQEGTGRPNQDGFLGDDDAHILIPSLASSQAPAPQENAAEATASSPEQATSEAQTPPPAVPPPNETQNSVVRLHPFPKRDAAPVAAPAPQDQTQPQSPPAPAEEQSPPPSPPLTPAGQEDEGAEIVPPGQGTSSSTSQSEAPQPQTQAQPQPQSQEPASAQNEAASQNNAERETHTTAMPETAGIWHVIKAIVMAPVHLVVWIGQMIMAAGLFLIHSVVWLFLLPFKLLAWLFHVIGEMIGDIFSKGHYLVKIIIFCIIAGISSILQKDDDEPDEKHFASEDEKEAYYNAAMLWFSVLLATEIEEFKQLLSLMNAGRRQEAFDWLETVLQREVGPPAHDILKDLAAARQEDTWRAFLRFSIALSDFLENVFSDYSEESEDAQQQRAREENYRQAQREGRPLPEDAPWYIVLEVNDDATAEEITQAYRRLIKQYHPDRFAQEGGQAYEEAQKKAQKLTEAYRYAKTLERFAEQKRSGSSSGPKANTSSSSSAEASSERKAEEELTPAEMEAYKRAGMLWAGWVSEFQLTDGSVLLDYLVTQRLRDAFRFLEALARSIEHEQARSVLDSLARGRTWQDLQRCSYQLCDLLRIVARDKAEEIRRQQEEKRAEEAERRRQQQKRQRARSSAPQGRPWHVVLEVSESATKEEIHASYKRLIKQYHPDRFAQKDEATKQEAAQRATELNQAYEYIKRHKTL